uniref:Uncharacterized protein n=1 Tax=Arion vulgaris TaxID=1028688 RepID=A0A0B6ZDD7_9EUPU
MSRLAEGDFHDDTVLRSPISARDQGSSGSLPPKRQVSANVLAEIEAFEELSMKILGTDSISK